MKKFRTELQVTRSDVSIHLKSAIFTQGSCFADAIGSRLLACKLRTFVNPFGVIYNPESIHKALGYSIFNEPLSGHTYLRNQEVHLNYDFHSKFAALTRDALTSQLNNTIGATHYALKDTDWLLLTYGTAWVYLRNDTGEIVANCHKVPASTFTKSLLSTEEIASSFSRLYRDLKRFNPAIRVILTVSPVRHLKDTFELNAVSKSILRVACHHISTTHADVEYFPAYEIMMDDLRDYRFYQTDMLHPTAEAEEYIWDKFMERYFSPELRTFITEWKNIVAAIRHRPFVPGTAAHQQFVRAILKKLEGLSEQVSVDDEILLAKRQLNDTL